MLSIQERNGYMKMSLGCLSSQHQRTKGWGCPHGVMVKALNCGIVVWNFKFKLCYYVHFRTNTLDKGMNPLILPSMG